MGEFRNFILQEMGEESIVTKRGSELFKDKAMEVAMYILYRQAYDPVAARDREEEITKMMGSGRSREEAENVARSPVQAWSIGEWKHPSGGGTRAPKWIFTGIIPKEEDLVIVRDHIQKFGVEDAVNELLKNKFFLSYCGGVSWRDDKEGQIKITGMWGINNFAKMRAGSEVVHTGNSKNLSILTGADEELKRTFEKSAKLMPKMYEKGMVSSPTFDLTTPPPEVVPLIYNMISQSPLAATGGTWKGFNPITGAFKVNLAGSGEREKYIFGNKALWANGFKKIIGKAGISPTLISMASVALKLGGLPAKMTAKKINKAIKEKIPTAPDISVPGLVWITSQVA
jgi:hypothetical protein